MEGRGRGWKVGKRMEGGDGDEGRDGRREWKVGKGMRDGGGDGRWDGWGMCSTGQ